MKDNHIIQFTYQLKLYKKTPKSTKNYITEETDNSKIKNPIEKISTVKSNSKKKKIFKKKLYQKTNDIFKTKIKFNLNSIIFLIFILLFIPISLSDKNISKLRQLNYDSEITITLKSGGNQYILNKNFKPIPNEVEINGVIVEEPNNTVNLPEDNEEKIITMRFNISITKCENMFYGLENITKIDFSKFDSSQVTDMKFMFNGCKMLEYINFTNINTSLVENMKDLFNGCSKLISLDLSYFDTSSVTDMTFIFYGCSSLKLLDLSNFNTKKVIYMNSVFNGCSNLTSIDITSFDTSSVNTTYGMFKNCIKLTSINLSNFNTFNITTMGYMFNNCSLLKSLELSNFDTSNVESMQNMFAGCTNLENLNLSNFKTSKVKNMDGMFLSCNNLLSLNLSNFDTSSVTTMQYMFGECSKLISLNVENFDTSKVTGMSNMFEHCKELTSLDLSSFNTLSVKQIKYMFNNCIKLEALNLSNFYGSNVTVMQNMFSECQELRSLDLSNFKASSVTNMQNLFSNCIKLTSLNLSNFNTIKANNMANMFYNCKKLKTLDVSNFETDSVTNMQNMFSGCENLVSLDISNFDLSKISRIDNMFSNCESLIYLNLDTIEINSKLKNKTDIFKGISYDLKFCANETTGDIFTKELNKASSCEDICFEKNIKLFVENKECLESCSNSEYQYEYNKICYQNCPLNTHKSSIDEYLCENDIKCKNYYNSDKSECFDDILDGYYLKDPVEKILDKCNEVCKTCDKKETQYSTNCNSCKNEKFLYFGNCIDSCEYDFDTDKFGNKVCKCASNDKCKNCTLESSKLNLCITCNDGFYPKLNDEMNQTPFINCYKEPEGFYLDSQNSIYKPCYKSCKTCEKEGTKIENNCLECKPNYKFIEDAKNRNNCYEKCDYYYYFDELNEYHCTTNDKCPDKQNKLILEKNKCIDECKNDNIYINEFNNICYKTCPINTNPNNNICIEEIDETIEIETQNLILNCSAEALFLTKSCGSEVSNPTNKDQLISNIENDIMNRKIEGLLNNITQTKQDLVVKEEDTIYQITTTENQNNNQYNNMSTVKLGDCEDRLKDIYGIDKNLPLIIFKIDYYSPGLLIPIIGYEIFHPENKSKLDLNYCKDILVELNIPVTIDEEKLFKYDPNSGYYTDECVPSTSENGTDILLNDRKNEYNENNLSLCQNNCTFTGYDTDTKKALCDCEVKTKIILITEIMNDNNKLSNNFTETESSSSNIITMKCVYTLFTKEGLKSNIGSYILLFVIVLFTTSSILFYKVGYVLLENCINNIILEKSKNSGRINKNDINIFKINKRSSMKKRKKRKSKTNFSNKGPNIEFPPKKKKSNKLHSSLKINENSSQSKLKLKDVKILVNFQRKSPKRNTKTKKISIVKEKVPNIGKIFFNDYELNSFSYEEAIMYDKRSYTQYYISLLKTKHPIYFSFIPTDDYNTMIVKICLFFLSFCIYYAVSALFITKNTIHQIYENGGSYNFSYSLPQIIYSFIISHSLSTVIKIIFLSERNILEIKKEKILNDARDKVDRVKRIIIIKYIVFFVLGILFLILFWYYLSSFGAVYQNSQVYLIKNTFISFLISLLYPFVINLFPGIFRIYSLDNRRDKEGLYKISKFISFL